MVGSIAKAIIEALRASKLIDDNNISVVLANDNGEGTINTALPAIAISMKDTEGYSGSYIGGMIQNTYVVQVIVITNFDNQSASPDKDFQYDLMDLPYKVMRYLAACNKGQIRNESNEWVHVPYFDELKKKYDFNLNYKGTLTEQTRGMARDMEIDVFVSRLVYYCSFTSKESSGDYPKFNINNISITQENGEETI